MEAGELEAANSLEKADGVELTLRSAVSAMSIAVEEGSSTSFSALVASLLLDDAGGAPAFTWDDRLEPDDGVVRAESGRNVPEGDVAVIEA
jgi:hypothetical protein